MTQPNQLTPITSGDPTDVLWMQRSAGTTDVVTGKLVFDDYAVTIGQIGTAVANQFNFGTVEPATLLGNPGTAASTPNAIGVSSDLTIQAPGTAGAPGTLAVASTIARTASTVPLAGNATMTGPLTIPTLTITASATIAAVAINGGTIAGVTLNGATITGGSIAPAAIAGTARTVTGAFTVTASDNNNTIAINVPSGGVAGTMTPGLPVGFVVEFSDLAGTLSGANEAVVTMAAGETVNGQATYVLNTAYASGRIKKLTSTQWSSK